MTIHFLFLCDPLVSERGMLKISIMIVILPISSCILVHVLLHVFQTYVIKYLQINDHQIFLGKCIFHYSVVSSFIPVNGYYKILQMTLRLSTAIAHPTHSSQKGNHGSRRWLTFLPPRSPSSSQVRKTPGVQPMQHKRRGGTSFPGEPGEKELSGGHDCVPRVERLRGIPLLEGFGRWEDS